MLSILFHHAALEGFEDHACGHFPDVLACGSRSRDFSGKSFEETRTIEAGQGDLAGHTDARGDAMAQAAKGKVVVREVDAIEIGLAGQQIGRERGRVTLRMEAVYRLDEVKTVVLQGVAPGVPWTYCRSDGHQIAVTLKSGNFGNETFFTDASERPKAA